MPPKKIAFIVNPISGKKKQKNISTFIERYLDTNKFEYAIYISKNQHHIKTLTNEAIKKNYEIIIAVGGDGTVNEVFQHLVGANVVLGIIPAGSGNGLARYLNIPQNIKKAVKFINHLSVNEIDTAVINNHPFINISGIGFDAEVANLFAGSSKRGFWTYVKIVLKSYFKYNEKEYLISIDNGSFKKINAFVICFANSNQFGNNFYIAPKAKITDGLIDVCIVNKIPIWAFPSTLFLIYLKLIDKSRFYNHFRANKIRIKSADKQVVNIDGEPIPMGNELELSLRPLSINIICPKIQ